MEEKKVLSPHSLMLENRQGGRITGVKDVKSFDEKEILLFYTGRQTCNKRRTASCEAARSGKRRSRSGRKSGQSYLSVKEYR